MWYFTWVLGVAFAVMFAAGCGLWFENQVDNLNADTPAIK
jgi:cyd operon protein YbgT